MQCSPTIGARMSGKKLSENAGPASLFKYPRWRMTGVFVITDIMYSYLKVLIDKPKQKY